MEVRNCRNCGKLFNYIGGSYRSLCPACIDKLEEKFQEVKAYVEDNRGVTMNDLTQRFEVDARQIEKWVREERLCFAEDSPIGIGCEKCGKMIKTGKYCPACAQEMENLMTNLYKASNNQPFAKKKDGNRMRFLDK
ncbi:MAG: FeoC-like transcriptional regulator [Lachnospiraceae bacterium]